MDDRYISYQGEKPICSWTEWRMYAISQACSRYLAELEAQPERKQNPLEQKAFWTKRDDYGKKSSGR